MVEVAKQDRARAPFTPWHQSSKIPLAGEFLLNDVPALLSLASTS